MIKKIGNVVFYAVAVFYVFLMLDLFFRIDVISSGGGGLRSCNLIPFRTILDYAGGNGSISGAQRIRNIFGNIAVFVPYGLYLQTLLKNKAFGKSLLIAAATSISIEIVQYVFRLGAADIDDVILNVCGGLLGIAGYRVLRKSFREAGRTKTAVALLSLVIGLPVMFLYFLVNIRRHF